MSHFSLSRRKPGSILPLAARIKPSNNCNDLPTDETFVQRSDGPRLPQGKREAERERNSFTGSEERFTGARLEEQTLAKAGDAEPHRLAFSRSLFGAITFVP